MGVYLASVTGSNILGFSNPAYIPATSLFSFHPIIFTYFILATFLVPYPMYRFIAKRYKWETNHKTVARHWSDTMLAFSYGVILFVFGNYTRTFSWITIITFYPSLFAYGLIAELPFAKTSLPDIKNWPKSMWILFLVALSVILAFAGIHIYIASQLELPFVIYYVCSLLIPGFFLTVAILLIKETNTPILSHKWRQHQEDQSTSHRKVSLHIHHWQIFYTLAFYTRFMHPISQVASGIVLACYMQGIYAYGYDPLVNDD
ncbi:uncharacterized protein BX663DRAFT_527416 [Cokeromyces recurvatus]|uniref:uncharacterized protein n=1 Tax=Cokeromyces recurvatus TaxID=90255 RepID=UPI00221EABB9|nr:uncharacterized protein BX663DRAFT_527416 [Cokeromyces recurvatus]KAI7897749.1 hypothetical protein BX663DRAFT_527416 [Cokeromyces recurvatus]